jgi:hypothetical protein
MGQKMTEKLSILFVIYCAECKKRGGHMKYIFTDKYLFYDNN